MAQHRNRDTSMRSAVLTRLASMRSSQKEIIGDKHDADLDSPASIYSQASALRHGNTEESHLSKTVPPIPPIPVQFQHVVNHTFLAKDPRQSADAPPLRSHRSNNGLEESVAFPFPTVNNRYQASVSMEPNTSETGLFQSLSSAVSSPSYSPSDKPLTTPATAGAIISLRSTYVRSNMPHYDMAEVETVQESGMVGYHLPDNWRHLQAR